VDRVEETLRRIALNDEQSVGSALAVGPGATNLAGLDPKTRALIRLGALVSLGATATSYRWTVEVAYGAGATDDELLAVLSAVAPAAGLARVVSAAPALALAMGYDVADDLT
jgi:4-carboxymuconolactone decarboxylase